MSRQIDRPGNLKSITRRYENGLGGARGQCRVQRRRIGAGVSCRRDNRIGIGRVCRLPQGKQANYETESRE